MPLNGRIWQVNEDLRADPALANSDPLGHGWFFKITLSERSQFESLMDEMAYARFTESN
jgi:glycine cleavage system H protein